MDPLLVWRRHPWQGHMLIAQQFPSDIQSTSASLGGLVLGRKARLIK